LWVVVVVEVEPFELVVVWVVVVVCVFCDVAACPNAKPLIANERMRAAKVSRFFSSAGLRIQEYDALILLHCCFHAWIQGSCPVSLLLPEIHSAAIIHRSAALPIGRAGP